MSVNIQFHNRRIRNAYINDNVRAVECIETYCPERGWLIHIDYGDSIDVVGPDRAYEIVCNLRYMHPSLHNAASDIYASVLRVREFEAGGKHG